MARSTVQRWAAAAARDCPTGGCRAFQQKSPGVLGAALRLGSAEKTGATARHVMRRTCPHHCISLDMTSFGNDIDLDLIQLDLAIFAPRCMPRCMMWRTLLAWRRRNPRASQVRKPAGRADSRESAQHAQRFGEPDLGEQPAAQQDARERSHGKPSSSAALFFLEASPVSHPLEICRHRFAACVARSPNPRVRSGSRVNWTVTPPFPGTRWRVPRSGSATPRTNKT